MNRRVFALLILLIAACGPSTRDVALAKVARYRGNKLVLFGLAREAAGKRQQILQSDETALTIETKGRWFTPEGLASNWGPNDGEGRRNRLQDKSLHISLTVKLLPDAEYWVVYIEPKISRFNAGMPNLEPVDPKHADVPGWATGKVDTLAWEIYKALRPYEVPGITGSTPEPPPYVPPPDAREEPLDPSAPLVPSLPSANP